MPTWRTHGVPTCRTHDVPTWQRHGVPTWRTHGVRRGVACSAVSENSGLAALLQSARAVRSRAVRSPAVRSPAVRSRAVRSRAGELIRAARFFLGLPACKPWWSISRNSRSPGGRRQDARHREIARFWRKTLIFSITLGKWGKVRLKRPGELHCRAVEPIYVCAYMLSILNVPLRRD